MVQMTGLLHRILAVIREEYSTEIDEDSVEVARFVTHLRYLFLRERQGKKLRETPAELHAALRTHGHRLGELLLGLLLGALAEVEHGLEVELEPLHG